MTKQEANIQVSVKVFDANGIEMPNVEVTIGEIVISTVIMAEVTTTEVVEA